MQLSSIFAVRLKQHIAYNYGVVLFWKHFDLKLCLVQEQRSLFVSLHVCQCLICIWLPSPRPRNHTKYISKRRKAKSMWKYCLIDLHFIKLPPSSLNQWYNLNVILKFLLLSLLHLSYHCLSLPPSLPPSSLLSPKTLRRISSCWTPLAVNLIQHQISPVLVEFWRNPKMVYIPSKDQFII